MRLAKNQAAASEIGAALNSADTDLDGLVDINELCDVLKAHRKDLVCHRSGFAQLGQSTIALRTAWVSALCMREYCFCRKW